MRLRSLTCFLLGPLLLGSASTSLADVRFPERSVRPTSAEKLQREGETWHPIQVDAASLKASPKSGVVMLPSTGGKPLPVRFQKLEQRDDGLAIWTGRVKTTTGEQSVVLTLGDGLTFGLIPQVDGPPLRIETRHGKTWLIEGKAPFAPVEGDDFTLPPPPTLADLEELRNRKPEKAAGDPRVDVLVLYTQGLVNVWGSTQAVHARIAQLEAITRQAYVDSGAAIDIRVVGRHMVDYTTKNSNADALAEMRSTTTSTLHQEAARMRSLYGADLVLLLRNFERGVSMTCGNGYLLGYHGGQTYASNGFSLVSDHGYGNDNCGDWTFAHELGHNMGSHHDTETAEGDYGAFTYSRGYRQTLGTYRGFATIMAYETADQWTLGIFSNPRLNQCLGQPCGLADTADNARSLSERASAMADLVPSIPAGSLPEVSISDVAVTEGNTGSRTARFTVSLSRAASAPVQVTLATTNGSAVSGSDFTALAPTQRTFAVGQTTLDVDIAVHGDTVVEANEAFGLSLQAISGAVVRDGQGIATIVNDEAIPTIYVEDVARPEGNSATVLIPVTIRLTAPSPTPVGFSLRAHQFAAGPASATLGEDFAATNLGNLSIPAGLTSETIYVASLGDTTVEQGESLYVVVSDVTGALVGDVRATVTLLDDDGPPSQSPRIGISDSEVTEGGAAQFIVSLSAPAPTAISFDAATTEQAATPGSDYLPLATRVTIPAGATSTTLTVQTVGDNAVEPDEDFWILLSNASGGVIDDFRGVAWIRDNDTPAENPGSGNDVDFRLRDDRIVVLNGETVPASVAILANDSFDPARLAGGSLTLVGYGNAIVEIRDNGTPAQLADDLLVFTPIPNFPGLQPFTYRLCEGGAGARCAEADVHVMVRPVLDPWLDSGTGSGFTDIVVPHKRPDPSDTVFSPQISVSALVAPERIEQHLAVDPTPSTPWDMSFAGTTTIMRTLSPAPDQPTSAWRILVDARMPIGDVDVYVGRDWDNNGAPADFELLCVAAMSQIAERCEAEISAGLQYPNRYWVMLHNRSAVDGIASAEVFAVPVPQAPYVPPASKLVSTAPGVVQPQDPHAMRLAWTDLGLLPGESRLAYVQLEGRESTSGLVPVRIDRTDHQSPAVSLASGRSTMLRLAPGAAQDRMFIDVPIGASELLVNTVSAQNVNLYLSRVSTPSSPDIVPAPARNLAVASALGAGGTKTLVISGASLVPGRWYVTPLNVGNGVADVDVRATVTGATVATRAGSYFNAARAGHGLFLYPAADQWTGLWYTFLQDGTPTWYYLQGMRPGANGIWTGGIYRSAWNGSSNRLTEVGRGQVTPTGPDAFAFSYSLDGETGSEPMTALGRGCPTLAASPLDLSSTWFNPARAGAGYSTQLFPNYEFYAAFVYDASGVPRFLLAESSVFAGADATFNVEQLTGFCPLCQRTGLPQRRTIGTLRRLIQGGTFANISVDAIYAGPLVGTWTANEAIQPLGGPGTTQGCQP